MRKYGRRDFLKSAGMGILAASCTTAQKTPQAGPQHVQKPAPFRLGVASYTFREFSLEQTIAMTKRLGLERISLKSFHLPLESSAADIKATAESVRGAGLDLYGCGVVYMKSEEEVHKAFAYAREAGMRMIIGVPNPELLELVNKKIQASGLKMAIHNHGPEDKLYPTPESIYEKIRSLDRRLGLCIDIGHTVRAGEDPSRSVEKFTDRLLDVHMKDVTAATKDGQTIEIGRGVIDIPRFLKALLKLDYAGTVAFEFEKDEKDPLPGLAESVGYVRGILAAV